MCPRHRSSAAGKRSCIPRRSAEPLATLGTSAVARVVATVLADSISLIDKHSKGVTEAAEVAFKGCSTFDLGKCIEEMGHGSEKQAEGVKICECKEAKAFKKCMK